MITMQNTGSSTALILAMSASFLTGCDNLNSSASKPEEPSEPYFKTTQALGQALFHDARLSLTGNQSCATCHNPQHGFIDTREHIATKLGVSLGDDGLSVGTRNTPTAAYAQFSPKFSSEQLSDGSTVHKGGQFWDGRAHDLTAQAGGPPLNPVEMAMPDKAAVVARLQENSMYVTTFKFHYGEHIWQDTEKAYQRMTSAIADFESSKQFAPFDSKWDRYLKGDYALSFSELTGKSVFFSNANSSCVNCHQINNKNNEFREKQTFTNSEYFNLGTPINHELRQYLQQHKRHATFIAQGDAGLYEHIAEDENLGKFKTPTLRNVAITGPYMHNGVFKELNTVLEFYNFRGTKLGNRSEINPETGQAWAETDYPNTIAFDDLGQQPMKPEQIDGLECFLRLLTDERYEHLLPPLREGLDCS